jgi:hypothetical protein
VPPRKSITSANGVAERCHLLMLSGNL